MDGLIQANLELHAELGKEVRINLENEAKISQLEKQQVIDYFNNNNINLQEFYNWLLRVK